MINSRRRVVVVLSVCFVTIFLFDFVSVSGGQISSLEMYGAIGDGITDDTKAINKAFSKAGLGSTILIPSGKTYAHNGIVKIIVPSLTITGGGKLLATNEQQSSIWVNANHIVIDTIVIAMKQTTQRWVEYEKHKLRLMNSMGIIIRNVTIDGSAAAGIYIGNCTNFLIDKVSVRNTRADAIHTTEGSTNGTINKTQIYNPGDDGVAFVSYIDDGVLVNNMVLQSPIFRSSTWGRAYSVVGGTNIIMNDLYSEDSDAAALYIASEPSFNTYGVSNVIVNGGVFVRSNRDIRKQIDHGSVLIYNGQSTQIIQNITITNISCTMTTSSKPWDVGILSLSSTGSGGSVRSVTINNVILNNGPPNAFYSSSPSSTYTTRRWIQNGNPIPDHVPSPKPKPIPKPKPVPQPKKMKKWI